MTDYSKLKELQIESLNEILFTAEYCLRFDKKTNSDWSGESKEGCLGIPSTILLCSIIDTIGSYFRGAEMQFSIDGQNHKIEKAHEHFFILNHEKFFNLNLAMTTINDFYSSYRSKLTHNSTLPVNHYLDIGSPGSEIFQLNSEKKIIKINLIPLLEITKQSLEALKYYLNNGTFSSDHKLSKELDESAKPFDAEIHILPSTSGVTYNSK